MTALLELTEIAIEKVSSQALQEIPIKDLRSPQLDYPQFEIRVRFLELSFVRKQVKSQNHQCTTHQGCDTHKQWRRSSPLHRQELMIKASIASSREPPWQILGFILTGEKSPAIAFHMAIKTSININALPF